jgi:hypothetical protein
LPWIDVVVDSVHPFDVRAELGLSGEIEREMHAEATRRRHRVDDTREGEPPKRCCWVLPEKAELGRAVDSYLLDLEFGEILKAAGFGVSAGAIIPR